MKKIYLAVLAIMALTCYTRGSAYATPSSQVWIPSADIQPFATVHLGVDNYTTFFKNKKDGGHMTPVDVGITLGALETNFVDAEIGVDIKESTDDPFYFNAKLGTKEDSLGKYFPAFIIGGYNFGTKAETTNLNILYMEIAKTLGSFGRLTAGYYVGNDKLLINTKGQKENDGVLLSYDRTMAEISPKLWLVMDYMGGYNVLGAASFGLSWRFSPQVSALLGYHIFNEPKLPGTGENMVTIQFDLDF
jgi:hypothetical protein